MLRAHRPSSQLGCYFPKGWDKNWGISQGQKGTKIVNPLIDETSALKEKRVKTFISREIVNAAAQKVSNSSES